MRYIGYKIAWKLVIDISGSLNIFFLSHVFLIKLIKGLDSPENAHMLRITEKCWSHSYIFARLLMKSVHLVLRFQRWIWAMFLQTKKIPLKMPQCSASRQVQHPYSCRPLKFFPSILSSASSFKEMIKN